MNKVLIVVVILVLLAGGGYYFYNNMSTQPASTIGTSQVPAGNREVDEMIVEEGESMTEESDVVEVVVEGSEFRFTPSQVTVRQGQTVRVVFKNTGTMPHDFVLDDFSIATNQLNPGGQETVEFVASSAGVYEYYCSVGNHRAQGMVGTLTVE